jgi:DNA polymerase III delta subunit
VEKAGAEIESAAARVMAERAGFPERPRPDGRSGDVGRLRGEVDRLLLYAMGQKKIGMADVQAVAGAAALQDDWAMANAIERGDGAEALRQLALALEAGAAPEAVLGQIAWVVRSKFPQGSADGLREAVDAVFRTDLELKRSSRSSEQPRILLERLIVELCGRSYAREARRDARRDL